jgi:hypothetical protein
MPSTLRELFEEQVDQYCSEDQNWVQFVRDHFQYLRNTAQEVTLDVYRHNTMKYRLEDFLEDQLKMYRSTAWIVLLINQMNSNVDFREMSSILIPDMRVIQYLRNTYNTVKANQENMV